MTFAMWEPPLTGGRGEAGAPVRRTATAEAAQLLADLVTGDVPRARVRAVPARRRVGRAGRPAAPRRGRRDAALRPRVAAYRSGYLPEERRALEERAAHRRDLARSPPPPRSSSASNVTGLDAVLMAGWPGTRAALWQQAGRAGRDGREAVAVLIARDDPLDTYLVHHPQALLGAPVEATVLDPDNAYVLTPHLCAAAAELPLSEPDLASFTETAGPLAARLAADGLLRSRGRALVLHPARIRGPHRPARHRRRHRSASSRSPPGGWSARWTSRRRTSSCTTARSTCTRARCTWSANLDLDERVALVEVADPGYSTVARELTNIEVAAELTRADWGEAGDLLR